MGNVRYAPEKDCIIWTIKQFQGGKEFLMRAHFGLPSISEETESKPPITVKFEIPYFTVSGIQVRYLKIIEKSGYQALPWVIFLVFLTSDFSRFVILHKAEIIKFGSSNLPCLFQINIHSQKNILLPC